MCKFIFVTGGVVSGLGKGITAASIGRLLKSRGVKVASQKLDPYINVDPGTMSPYQHGEVYVTEDGSETDLDLGHYERFINVDLNRYSNLTAGKVYWNVLNRERKGEYLGKTVQVIPHITDEIKNYIYNAVRLDDPDVLICEVGGTIGDIESQPFLEAIRQIGLENSNEALYIHVTLVPYLSGSDEHKSKPTQHSVKQLQGMGIRPDIIVLRCDESLSEDIFDKIALFCNIDRNCVIENRTLSTIYEVPLMLEKQHLAEIICEKLNLKHHDIDLSEWKHIIYKAKHPKHEVTIGIVGKYVQLHDAYLSIIEALHHAGYDLSCKVKINWIDSQTVTARNVSNKLKDCNGIIVPGGFGDRGIEGMIVTANHCRLNRIPYLGICLGMQVAAISFARNVLKLKDANSREFDPASKNKVIDFLPDQSDTTDKGGTLRLGSYPCVLRKGTVIRKAYKMTTILERHRHRYEFNNDYRNSFNDNGMIISGTSPDDFIVETIELKDHPFYVGVQFHPEFRSRLNHPHPLFMSLLKEALKKH